MKDSNQYDLDYIRNCFSIEQIATEYGVDLENIGTGLVALCPFHSDYRTKSFRIYEDTDSFYCFGCQRGGSIFDFVMAAENVSFAEAVEILAQRANLSGNMLPDLKDDTSGNLKQFKELRESIEKRITTDLRNLYFSIKTTCFLNEKDVYLKQVEDIWKWFDQSQRYFDKNLIHYKRKMMVEDPQIKAEFVEKLSQKLYSFYKAFVKRREEIPWKN